MRYESSKGTSVWGELHFMSHSYKMLSSLCKVPQVPKTLNLLPSGIHLPATSNVPGGHRPREHWTVAI